VGERECKLQSCPLLEEYIFFFSQNKEHEHVEVLSYAEMYKEVVLKVLPALLNNDIDAELCWNYWGSY